MSKLNAAIALFAIAMAPGLARADFIVTATLNAAQQTPPTPSPATGTATVTYITALNQLTYSYSYSGLTSPAVEAHIHFGMPGMAGPVILPFAPPTGTSGTISGVLTPSNLLPSPTVGINTFADALAAMQAGSTYVNIHTLDFPNGEIRGQLALASAAVPEPASLALLGLGSIGVLGAAIVRRKSTARGSL